MTESNSPSAAGAALGANLSIKGGAAIVAPISAFQGGVPPNALVVIPVKKPTEEFEKKINEGPLAVTPDQMWELLGFNGPAVQVQNKDGNPITIGLDDLLEGLDKHWKDNPTDLNRGRMYAQELMKHGRSETAATVLAKVVAGGGTGEDWLGLGVAQLTAGDVDKAEGTLKGALNLLPSNPFPALHLARVARKKEQADEEKTMVEKAIAVDPNCVDAWAFLYSSVKDAQDEATALTRVKELADAEPNKGSAAPFIALQGLLSADEKTRPQALEFAKVAVERDSDNSLALVSLSALLGQTGDLPAVVALLQKHETKMMQDARLANNYFEALMQTRDIQKVTKLLNALAGSPNREVKQFAIERSRMVAQLLQQQQQQLKGAK